jgi:hypothetical protein
VEERYALYVVHYLESKRISNCASAGRDTRTCQHPKVVKHGESVLVALIMSCGLLHWPTELVDSLQPLPLQ